jgi:hypothetical protein
MPEDTAESAVNPEAISQRAPEPPTPFHIGEEYGTAKKNLPPAKILLIAIGALALVAAVLVLAQRPHSAATGSIDNIIAVDVVGQNIQMVAINVTLHNGGDKVYWIKSIQSSLDANGTQVSDEAASAIDFERYFQAFPALKEGALRPLISEAKLQAGASTSGTVIVSFPVSAEVFAARKSLKLTIQPYDGVPLVLSK